MVPGLYRFHNVQADITGVFTNCVPTDAYRGAGRPEATHVIERMVGHARGRTEDGSRPRFESKTSSSHDEFPFPTATGLSYDSGQLRSSAATGTRNRRLRRICARTEEGARQGRLMGIGISTYGEICAFGPSPATPAGGWESATVKVEPSGKVTVLTGVSPHGQGEETTFAQIAADELGVGIDDVVVLHGDTAIVQYGIGTFGSRATAVGGAGTVVRAAGTQDEDAEVRRDAAGFRRCHLRGGACVCNKSGKSVSISDIAGPPIAP